MNLYVLDTDTFQLFQDEHSLVFVRVEATAPEDLAISVVTVEEQLSGWYALLRQATQPQRILWAYRRLAATARFLSRVQIVDFEEAAYRRYEELKQSKIKIGTNDLRIAAMVLERNAILVTRNLRDFQQVPGHQMEDWSK